MGTDVENRVVDLELYSSDFVKNADEAYKALEKLEEIMQFKNADKGFKAIEIASRNISFDKLSNSIDTVSDSIGELSKHGQSGFNKVTDAIADNAKGISQLQNAVDSVDVDGLTNKVSGLSQTFSALGVMGLTVFSNIANSVYNAGKSVVSALTIDPVKTGFQEYETQINAVQTILANTSSKGTTLKEVNKALDELNVYADKTIYNFTEMTRNIGTFTAAGLDLDTSVSAIQGIANVAAVSGSTSEQASRAMYQLSQALSLGALKLQDWNSVVNAGMGGEVFQDALKRTAREFGTNVDSIIANAGSFRESLKDGWITSEILSTTLKKFTKTGAAEYLAKLTGVSKKEITAMQRLVDENIDGTASYDDLIERLAATGKISKEDAKYYLEMADTAEDAATKVKTISQLKDTLKEAAQSGWTQSWELIIGDFEEAKKTLTYASDIFNNIISDSADARNKLIKQWKKQGGRDYAVEAILTSIKNLNDVITLFRESFKKVFGKIDVRPITNLFESISKGVKSLSIFKDGTRELTEFGTAVEKLQTGSLGIIENVLTIFKMVYDTVSPVVESLTGLISSNSTDILEIIGDALNWVSENVQSSLESISELIPNPFEKIASKIDQLKEDLDGIEKTKFYKKVTKFKQSLSDLNDTIDTLKSRVKEIAGPFKEMFEAIFKGPDKKDTKEHENFFNMFNGGVDFLIKQVNKLNDKLKESKLAGNGIYGFAVVALLTVGKYLTILKNNLNALKIGALVIVGELAKGFQIVKNPFMVFITLFGTFLKTIGKAAMAIAGFVKNVIKMLVPLDAFKKKASKFAIKINMESFQKIADWLKTMNYHLLELTNRVYTFTESLKSGEKLEKIRKTIDAIKISLLAIYGPMKMFIDAVKIIALFYVGELAKGFKLLTVPFKSLINSFKVFFSSIGNAASAIASFIKNIIKLLFPIKTVKDSFKEFTSSLTIKVSMKPFQKLAELMNVLGGHLRNIAVRLDRFAASLRSPERLEKIRKNLDAFRISLLIIYAPIKKFVDAFKVGALILFGKAINFVQTRVKPFLSAFKTESLEKLANAMTTIEHKIKGGFAKALLLLMQIQNDLKKRFEPFMEAINYWVPVIKGYFNTIGNIFSKFYKSTKFIISSEERVKKSFKEIIETLSFNLKDVPIIGTLLKALNSILGIGDKLRDSATKFGGAIKDFFMPTLNGLKGVFDGLHKRFEDFETILKRSYRRLQADTAFVAFTANLTRILSALQRIILYAYNGRWDRIGENLVNGLIEGIKGAASALGGVIKAIAKDVLDAFLKAFDIHSPSRKTREIGIRVMEGLIVGIQTLSSALSTLLSTMAGEALKILTKVFSVINDHAPELLDQLSVFLSMALDAILKMSRKIIQTITQLIVLVADGLADGIPVFLNAINKILQSLVKALKSGNKVVDQIADAIVTIFSLGVKISVKKLSKSFVGTLDTLINGINDIASKTLLGDGGGGKFDKIVETIKSIGVAMLEIAIALKIMDTLNPAQVVENVGLIIGVINSVKRIFDSTSVLNGIGLSDDTYKNIIALGVLILLIALSLKKMDKLEHPIQSCMVFGYILNALMDVYQRISAMGETVSLPDLTKAKDAIKALRKLILGIALALRIMDSADHLIKDAAVLVVILEELLFVSEEMVKLGRKTESIKNATNFMKELGKVILELAAAILILDQADHWLQDIALMTTIVLALYFTTKLTSKLSGKYKTLNEMIPFLKKLAEVFIEMAAAIWILDKADNWWQDILMLLSIVGALYLATLAISKLSGKHKTLNEMKPFLEKLAEIFILMAAALYIADKADNWLQDVLAIGAMMGALLLTVWILSKLADKTAAVEGALPVVKTLALIFILLAVALRIAGFNPVIAQVAFSLSAMLLAIAASVYILSKISSQASNLKTAAVAMAALAVCVTLMAGAMWIMGQVADLSETAKAFYGVIIAIVGAITVLSIVGTVAPVAMALAPVLVALGVAVIAFAYAMQILSKAILTVSKANAEDVSTAISLLAKGLLKIGLAAIPAGIGIAVLGAGMVVLGVGVAALGIGILAASAGISLFAAGFMELVMIFALMAPMVNQALDNFIGMKDKLIEVVSALLEVILTSLQNSATMFVDTAIDTLLQILTALDENSDAIFDKVESIMDKLLDFLIEKAPEWGEKGVDLIFGFIDGLWAGFSKRFPGFSSFLTEQWDNLVKSVKEFFGINPPEPSKTFGEIAHDIIDGLVQGISSLISTIAETGHQIVNGLIDGIKEWGSQHLGKVGAWLFGKVKTGTEEAAEIESPSKVMKRLGAFVTRGFILGIQNESAEKALYRVFYDPIKKTEKILSTFIKRANQTLKVGGKDFRRTYAVLGNILVDESKKLKIKSDKATNSVSIGLAKTMLSDKTNNNKIAKNYRKQLEERTKKANELKKLESKQTLLEAAVAADTKKASEINKLKKTLKSNKTKRKSLNTQLETSIKEQNELQTNYDKLVADKKKGKKVTSAELAEAKRLLTAKKSEVSILTARLANLDKTIASDQNEIDTYEKDKKAHTTDLAKVKKDISNTKKTINSIDKDISSMENKYATIIKSAYKKSTISSQYLADAITIKAEKLYKESDNYTAYKEAIASEKKNIKTYNTERDKYLKKAGKIDSKFDSTTTKQYESQKKAVEKETKAAETSYKKIESAEKKRIEALKNDTAAVKKAEEANIKNWEKELKSNKKLTDSEKQKLKDKIKASKAKITSVTKANNTEIKAAEKNIKTAKEEYNATKAANDKKIKQIDELINYKKEVAELDKNISESEKKLAEEEKKRLTDTTTLWTDYVATFEGVVKNMSQILAEGIGTQIDIFSRFEKDTSKSISTILKDMKSQVEGTAEFYNNLEKLGEKGFNVDFIRELESQGTSAAGVVSTLAKATKAEIDEINKTWQAKTQLEGSAYLRNATQSLVDQDALVTLSANLALSGLNFDTVKELFLSGDLNTLKAITAMAETDSSLISQLNAVEKVGEELANMAPSFMAVLESAIEAGNLADLTTKDGSSLAHVIDSSSVSKIEKLASNINDNFTKYLAERANKTVQNTFNGAEHVENNTNYFTQNIYSNTPVSAADIKRGTLDMIDTVMTTHS